MPVRPILALRIADDALERIVGVGVGPARNDLRLAVDKELDMPRGNGATKAARLHGRETTDTEGFQIDLAHVAPRFRRQARQDGRIVNPRKSR